METVRILWRFLLAIKAFHENVHLVKHHLHRSPFLVWGVNEVPYLLAPLKPWRSLLFTDKGKQRHIHFSVAIHHKLNKRTSLRLILTKNLLSAHPALVQKEDLVNHFHRIRTIHVEKGIRLTLFYFSVDFQLISTNLFSGWDNSQWGLLYLFWNI